MAFLLQVPKLALLLTLVGGGPWDPRPQSGGDVERCGCCHLPSTRMPRVRVLLGGPAS